MSITSTNSYLRQIRKSDLLELAEAVGFTSTDGLKKLDLEVALDDYLTENQTYSSHPMAAPFYQARARATGSPIKKDPVATEPRKRRGAAKLAERAISPSVDDHLELPSTSATPALDLTALHRRVPLPASPAEVMRIVDERTDAWRQRFRGIMAESGIETYHQNARDALSTVTSIILCITAFEAWNLRKEILADRYAFTWPAIHVLGTSEVLVKLPDMFLLLHGSFWKPFLLWFTTSVSVPALFGYYFNLSAAHSTTNSRRRSSYTGYEVDPLTFSIAKAVITYVVYQQGNSLWGWVNQDSVARINSTVYGGWKGMLTGALISGVIGFYDAILNK